jgi:Zn-dependent membrane protease YugP
MQAINLFLEIGKTLTIIHYVPGRIRLRFSKSSLPLIKKFSEIDSFKAISVEQFIDSLNGINNVKVNKIVGSATIQYNPDDWNKGMWESLCSGRSNLELTKKVTDAINNL